MNNDISLFNINNIFFNENDSSYNFYNNFNRYNNQKPIKIEILKNVLSLSIEWIKEIKDQNNPKLYAAFMFICALLRSYPEVISIEHISILFNFIKGLIKTNSGKLKPPMCFKPITILIGSKIGFVQFL